MSSPGKPRRGNSRAAEVAFGTAAELPILQRWLKVTGIDHNARVIRSRDRDDFDFYLKTAKGYPLSYVEVKLRRTPFGEYGDVIVPLRKVLMAQELGERHRIPFVLVTQYGCGTLVEVDLAQEPARTGDITRRDRPGEAVPHAYYEGEQLVVLDGPGLDGLEEAA